MKTTVKIDLKSRDGAQARKRKRPSARRAVRLGLRGRCAYFDKYIVEEDVACVVVTVVVKLAETAPPG